MKKNWLVVILAVLFWSCESDLENLPEDPNANITETPTTTEGFKAVLAAAYANLSQPGTTGAFDSNIAGIDGGTSTFSRTLWYMQELPTDEALWSYENDAGVAPLQRGTWTAANEFCLGAFSRMSLGIFLASDFLRQANGASVQEIEQMRSEARFLRALNYYYLLDLFGKAPLVTENDIFVSGFLPPEIAGVDLFNHIEAEVLESVANLPDASAVEYGRASKGAAYFLLAKLYLNAEVYGAGNRYEDCVEQLNNIIGQGYSLNPTYQNNFTADNNISPEIIFPIISDGIQVQNFGGTTIVIQGSVASNAGEDALPIWGVGGFGGALRLKQQASEIIQAEGSGVRNNLFTQGRTIDNPSIAERSFGYTPIKFINRTSAGEIGSSNNTNAFVDTDFPLFRFADVHLMYAECALRGASNADMGTATTLVNQLRTRAEATQISQSELNLEWLLDERVKELYWEGHRRQDLIRFGLFGGGTYRWEWKGSTQEGTSISITRELYPVPALSLSANSNLTQNPGY